MEEGGTNKMCIICVDMERDRLDSIQARVNLGEMRESLGAHAETVEEKIFQKEIEELLTKFVEEIDDEGRVNALEKKR